MAEVRNITWTDPALATDVKTTDALYPRTATGYGAKIPTRYMIRYARRWHRVYMMVYSNSGTAYIVKGRTDLVLDQATEYTVTCHSEGRTPDPSTLDVIAKYDTNRSAA